MAPISRLKPIYSKGRGAVSRLVGAADRQLMAMRHQRMRPTLLVNDEGPGGPLLVVVGNSNNDFSRYLIEILRAEGINCFRVVSIDQMTSEVLANHKVVLLAALSLSAQQGATLTSWVEGGGSLLAMRPDQSLASLLGIEPMQRSLVEGYLKVDATCPPGVGITNRVMQFHGVADCYRVVDADVVAELFADSDTPTIFPAVTTRSLGESGGRAAAFTYDLARSVVYTRQGNPAWVGKNRDGDLLNRSDDLFFGAAEGDVQRDWVDPDLLDLPQADEQQRLMVNVLRHLCAEHTTLPRFWYLPDRVVATIVMTGDDHALNGTAERFNDYASLDTPSSEGGYWEQIRGTSYVYAHSPMTDKEAKDLENKGFEISLHLTTKGKEYDLGSLSRAYRRQLKLFRKRYPSLRSPRTHRTHCVVWSDWSTQAEVERSYGIRLDTNYYFYPAPWVAGRVGQFTGSGIPMRFASTQGEVIDCYQAATQLTDETNQVFPETITAVLDQAFSSKGKATVITANMHTDLGASSGSDAIVAEACRRDVPVISAGQLLDWFDHRSASSFSKIERDGDLLRFSISTPPESLGLTAMVPLPPGFNRANSVMCNGSAVVFTTEEFWGAPHAVFSARVGNYEIRCSTAAESSSAAEAEVEAKPAQKQMTSFVSFNDFSEGNHEGTTFSNVRGGALILTPGMLLEDQRFEASDVRTTLSHTLNGGGSLEAEVSFSGYPDQWVGLVADCGLSKSITFSIDSSRKLNAVNTVGDNKIVTPIPGNWFDAPHRFRIDWDPGLTLFGVDGRTIAEHRIQLHEPLCPTIANLGAGPALHVSWLRTSNFALSGTFTSIVHDMGTSSFWGHATLTSPALTMTGAKLAVRSGESDKPDESWSAWIWPGVSGEPMNIRGRYLQYQVQLLTASYRWTPEVTGISIERCS